ALWVPGEAAVAHEPWGPGVADEEGSDDQLQLVGEVVGQELGVHLAAALDHQPPPAAGAEVLADPAHLHRLATVDYGRHLSKSRAGVDHPLARAVDELLRVAGGEEVGAGVQSPPLGGGDLDWRLPESTSRPLVTADLRTHEQPRVVVPHGSRAHQDRV